MNKEEQPDGIRFWPTYRALAWGFLTSLFDKELYKEFLEYLLGTLQVLGILALRLVFTITFPVVALVFALIIIRENKRKLEHMRKWASPIER